MTRAHFPLKLHVPHSAEAVLVWHTRGALNVGIVVRSQEIQSARFVLEDRMK